MDITSQNQTTSEIRGASFQRNCGAASVGVLQDNLVLSTGLIMRIGHRKEIPKLPNLFTVANSQYQPE